MGAAMNTGNRTPTTPGGRMRTSKRNPTIEAEESIHPRLLSVDRASTLLGISTHSLRHRIAEGAIPYVRLNGGRRILLDIRDLERLIEAWKVNGE